MARIMLYTQETADAGVVPRDVWAEKGAVTLRIVTKDMAYEFKPHGGDTRSRQKSTSVKGEADLLLQISGQPDIDLAACRGAVALQVFDGETSTIYWLREGQCYEISHRVAHMEARLLIEDRHRPAGGLLR